MKTYVVALWETRLSAKPTHEITSIAETPIAAACDAMEAAKWFSWGVVVVMNDEKQTTFFDAEWRGGEFLFSKTEEFSRLADNPFIENSKKWRA